jgi:uncharacterized protein (DUF58 family)
MAEHLPQTNYLDPEVLQKLGGLELVAREIVEGLRVGTHRSPLRGFSTEFAHHRQYAPGDAIRTIDWRVFGRTDRYYTKLYEAETNFDCYILIDASSSMNYASGKVSKLEYAKYLAASLAYMVLRQRDSVGLSIFDSEVRAYLPPRSSLGIIMEIDRLLRNVKPTSRTSIAKQLHDIALMIKRRSLVVLVSDLFSDVDDILAGLDHLRFNGHDVVVLHTLDPHELEFPFKGAWCFEGLEEEEPLTTQADRIQGEYLTNFNKYMESLRDGCVASQIDYTTVNTALPLDDVLSEFIVKRQAVLNGGRG